MNGQAPTTPTTPEGQELVNKNQHQGDIISDASNDRILSGFQKDGFTTGGNNFGFKVSKAGYDVKTATPDQLIMSSDFNMFKIVTTGTTSISTSANSFTTVTVAHGQSGIPAVLAYGLPPANEFIAGTNYESVPVIYYGVSVGKYYPDSILQMAINSTNISFTLARGTGSPSSLDGLWYIKYYILAETAS